MMDAQVDKHLGDSITYKINGVAVQDEAGNATVPAFLILQSDEGGWDGVKSLQRRWQMKIAKRYVSAISMKHTVQAAKLDGIYRPAANNPVSSGAYWVTDLQKAPA